MAILSSHALEPPAGRRSKGAIEACICHLHFRAPELKIARFLRSRDASGWTALFKFNKYIACAHTRLLWQHTAHVHMLSLHCRGQRTRAHEHNIIIEASFRIFKARCAAGARGSCMQQCMCFIFLVRFVVVFTCCFIGWALVLCLVLAVSFY